MRAIRRVFMLSKVMQKRLMRVAIEEAKKAIRRGDKPVGGLIVDKNGNIIVSGGNREVTDMDPTAHAEMVLIREACKKLKKRDLKGYISICTAESCPMCTSALIIAGIREFYFGAYLEKTFNPYITMTKLVEQSKGDFIIVDGVLNDECTQILKNKLI